MVLPALVRRRWWPTGFRSRHTPPHRTPDFVGLGALEDLAPPARRDDAASPRVELRLELGGGLVLHLVRG